MCDRFNIDDVARLHGITAKEKGGEFFATCPFCGDTRGKFSYFIRKGKKENLYHCWACDAGGTAIDLHINLSPCGEYSGMDGYKRAIKDIFKALKGDSSFEEYHSRSEEAASRTEESIDKASDGQCSAVYFAMLKVLKLEDSHRDNLKKRGFSDEDIKRFLFRSVPKDSRTICRALIKKGYNLEGVPGFFQNKRGDWCMALPGAKEDGKWQTDTGYFCPVFDGEENLILGMQIRVDNPRKDSGKYVWFSSAGKKCGVSSGSLASYLPGENEKVIMIVEGILKSIAVYTLLDCKVTVIGIPGVKIIKSAESYLDRFALKGLVYEAYDMDKVYLAEDSDYLDAFEKNPDDEAIPEEIRHRMKKAKRISEDAAALRQMVSDRGLPVRPLTWDFTKEKLWKGDLKGPDDFLNGYDGKEKFVNYLLSKAQPVIQMQEYLTRNAG